MASTAIVYKDNYHRAGGNKDSSVNIVYHGSGYNAGNLTNYSGEKIIIFFKDKKGNESIYVYRKSVIGPVNYLDIISLANQGSGLNSFLVKKPIFHSDSETL